MKPIKALALVLFSIVNMCWLYEIQNKEQPILLITIGIIFMLILSIYGFYCLLTEKY